MPILAWECLDHSINKSVVSGSTDEKKATSLTFPIGSIAKIATCFPGVLRGQLMEKTIASPFFNNLINEGTDIAIYKTLITCVAYIGPNRPSVDFLGLS